MEIWHSFDDTEGTLDLVPAYACYSEQELSLQCALEEENANQ